MSAVKLCVALAALSVCEARNLVLSTSANEVVRGHTSHLALRGGATDAKQKKPSSLLVAMKLPQFQLDKVVDTCIAGLGLTATFALMGALEPRLGVKLFVPPMMASGLIFFSPATPPSPKGFISGTIGCASVSAAVLSLLSGTMSGPAAQGAAAGALLVWYKATGCIFPPAAVLCVLMSGLPAGTAPASWVAAPWIAGHACLYASAYGVSQLRGFASSSINKQQLRSNLKTITDAQLKEIFNTFDTSNDGYLDATELRVALRVALKADLSLRECQSLIEQLDSDGTASLDFGEFKQIITSKTK